MQRLAGRFLAGRAPLFGARIRGGHMVDGHGDLLAEDVFCLKDGPQILDCLEFDDRLRWVDGLDDAAFLAMDLERLGASELAEQFTGWYTEYSGDPAPTSLRHHYIAYRAFVRAKISCLPLAARAIRWQAPRPGNWPPWRYNTCHAGAITLVLIGGLPGTGQVGAGRCPGRPARLHRAEQRPDPQGTRQASPRSRESPAPLKSTGIYSPSWTERTYPRAASPGRGAALTRRISDCRRLMDLRRPPRRRGGYRRGRGRRDRPTALHGTCRTDRPPDKQQKRRRLRRRPHGGGENGSSPGPMAGSHHHRHEHHHAARAGHRLS